ncbi:hypothetical protein [Pseudomonas petrae]|uniref:hypothetical protein n=1 Tax=Pseudomonas petrae TaxID=2912190 RepID=UPI00235195E4|nr:hypothetical protein [Pseudomonas petrae]
MDRQIVYPAQILPETGLLQMAKDSMIGSAKLASAMLGTSTYANGFAVTPTGPASLQVVYGPGEIYSMASVDALAFSTLPADTTHSILKQGIALDGGVISCPAPGTSGQSINYLIQAAYQDVDANPVLLPYYNSDNPAMPYSGQGNNGLTQNTVRRGTAVVQAKPGASATSGSQVTPAPDSGYVGLYVVTVANGQTAITSGNITKHIAAPLLAGGILPSVQNGSLTYAQAAGSATACTVSYAPAVTSLTDGLTLRFKALFSNTGSATFSPNGLTPKVIINLSQNALTGAEISANGYCTVTYSAGFDAWILTSSSGGTFLGGRLIGVQSFTQAGGTYVPALGTNFVVVEVQGGGGGGGGAPATASGVGSAAGGGGAGGYSSARLTSGFAGVAVNLGAGGAGGNATPSSGGNGGSSSFGTLVSASGGGGGSFMAATATYPIQAAGANGAVGGAGNIATGPGAGGGAGVILTAGNGISGAGGPSHFGGGGFKAVGSAPGGAGVYGGGGGGAISQGNTGGGFAGGAGGLGLVIVWEYA